ncbi:SRPBCC family protein [Streptomyces chumphonensis]|uniref:SRPBCC family protein n=1 Tax=Streptomyces chumphonensis TaxID=1214925 RepID=UPI003D73F3B3
MRYADGPATSSETHVDATPATVWTLVADIGIPARFSPELQRVEWLDGAGAAVPGALFAGHNENPDIGEWTTTSRITEVAEERVFAWDVVDPDGRFGAPAPAATAEPLCHWRFELSAADGGTLLRHSVRVGPAPSGLSSYIAQAPEKEEEIIAGRLASLRGGIEATLAGIKELAEAR